MVNSKKIPNIIVFIVFYCLLASAQACMTFGNNLWVEIAAAAVCSMYFASKGAIRFTNTSIVASLLLLSASVYYIHGGSFAGYISKAMLVSLALVLINLKDAWKIELFETISRWFGILMGLSMILWLLHFFMPLPHTTAVVEMNNVPINSYNYFLFRETMFSDYSSDIMQRYQGMFLEPGHLGTIVAVFLINNCFDFKKKENWVFLIACILSLSASSYLLVALGFVFYRFSANGNKKFVISSLILIVLIIFFANYNGGDNLVNNLIFGKLTREDGAVQSRVSLGLLAMFDSMWQSGRDLIFGKGWEVVDMENSGAGIILFFVVNGIFGTALLILAYYSIYCCCKSRYGFFVFLIYLVSFLQRTYPYWDAFSLPFILGLPFILRDQQRHELQNKNERKLSSLRDKIRT